MQASYVFVPYLKEEFHTPISFFASSDEEAFEKFLRKSSLKKFNFQDCAFQIFKLGSLESGWSLVPLKEEFLKHLKGSLALETTEGEQGAKLKHCEEKLILDTLKLCGGKKARAARILGVSRRTIYRKLKEWDLG